MATCRRLASAFSECLVAAVGGEPQHGVVHSVFPAAANLFFQVDRFVSLNPTSAPALPNGIQLAVSPGSFPFTALRPGMPVLLGAQRLVVDALNWTLDLSTCARWSPEILPAETIERSLLTDQLARLSSRLALDNETLDFASPEDLACTFAGRGVGLTPAGDDLLLGWMAANWRLYGAHGEYQGYGSFESVCRRVVEIARTRTHALSLCWLRHASLGEVALPLKSLVEALTTNNGEICERQARIVLGIGATSGQHMLRGVYLALQTYL